MSNSITLFSYDKEKLIRAILNSSDEISNRELLVDILDCFGSTVNGRYILFCNTYYKDYNPEFGLFVAIRELFHLTDSDSSIQFDILDCIMSNDVDTERKELITASNTDSAINSLKEKYHLSFNEEGDLN